MLDPSFSPKSCLPRNMVWWKQTRRHAVELSLQNLKILELHLVLYYQAILVMSVCSYFLPTEKLFVFMHCIMEYEDKSKGMDCISLCSRVTCVEKDQQETPRKTDALICHLVFPLPSCLWNGIRIIIALLLSSPCCWSDRPWLDCFVSRTRGWWSWFHFIPLLSTSSSHYMFCLLVLFSLKKNQASFTLLLSCKYCLLFLTDFRVIKSHELYSHDKPLFAVQKEKV